MFGKGRIDISVPKINYAPGDVISGDVALRLSRPVKAREVSISLIGEQWITNEYSDLSISLFEGGGSSGMSSRKESIYELKQQLDGEKEYSGGREYRFDMKIQGDIQPSSIKWCLLAKLDTTGAFPISKRVDITIG